MTTDAKKTHLKPDGGTGKCSAKHKCPYTQANKHHANAKDARTHYEQEMAWINESPAFAHIEWDDLTSDLQLLATLPETAEWYRTSLFVTTEAGKLALQRHKRSIERDLKNNGKVDRPETVKKPTDFDHVNIDGFSSFGVNAKNEETLATEQIRTQKALLRRASLNWMQQLTTQEMSTVYWLTTNVGAEAMRDYTERGYTSFGYSKKELELYKSEFESAMGKAPKLRKRITVYRGARHDDEYTGEVNRNISAATNVVAATSFLDASGSAIYQFEIDTVASPAVLSRFGWDEYEVYLPHGYAEEFGSYKIEVLDPFGDTLKVPVKKYECY